MQPLLTLLPQPTATSAAPIAIEFFAGIGLARIGLELAGFDVKWSNDFEADKQSMYAAHFKDEPSEHSFVLGDIGDVSAKDLPAGASIAWASSPCTDLSLAGARAGLAGKSSGTFYEFTRILGEMDERPEVVVLENVTGLATSHGGDDLAAAVRAFNDLGYSVDVLTLDARRFVPQSRPRIFLVGALTPPADAADAPSDLRPDWLQAVFKDPTLKTHRAKLPAPPAPKVDGFGRVVEKMSLQDERWWDAERTASFVASLSPMQVERVEVMRKAKAVSHRTAYRRTRGGVAVWEVRPDDIAGCLRTARGGSSKQAVVRLGGGSLKARWMTPLEYARLMGAEDYNFSGARTNQAMFGFGDAVAVPAVAWLGEHYLMPLVRGEFRDVSESLSAVSSV